MGARGRPSRAELSVVAFEEAEARRPDPPADLAADPAKVWRDIVESVPADWVTPANAPLMASYVRHVVACPACRCGSPDRAADRGRGGFGRLQPRRFRQTSRDAGARNA